MRIAEKKIEIIDVRFNERLDERTHYLQEQVDAARRSAEDEAQRMSI